MSLISLLRNIPPRYPAADQSFSPAERYPEYPFDHVSSRPNHIYDAVRRTFAEAGLDRQGFGTAGWNPLGEFIRRGSAVFVLCNFVYHRKPHENEREFSAKCTDGSVLRALLDYVLLAVGPEGTVRFGNAPLQSTDWSRVLRDARADVVERFYQEHGAAVSAHDLRLFIAERGGAGGIRGVERRDERSLAVHVDMSDDSLLSRLDGAQRFRVGDYDPRRTESFHADGRHVYVINRLVLESDVVISLPKLKTHEKVGITVGLKGFVGAIGHKDCLAHHRRGGPREGGDEYPRRTPILTGMTALHEWLQQQDPSHARWNGLRVVDRTLRRMMVRTGGTIGGAWHGNDTAWRMALDIGRILHHATVEGRMRDDVQRRHLLFVDGVIGGDANGPLAPEPVDSGMLLFSDDVAAGDYVCARFMGFDPDRIQLVSRAFDLDRYRVTSLQRPEGTIKVEGREIAVQDAGSLAPRPFAPPPGWVGHMEAAT